MVWPFTKRQPTNQGYPVGFRPPHPPKQVNYPPHIRQGFFAAQQTQGFFTPEKIVSLTHKLENFQRVLKTVQTAVPIIQQYAPIMKNLPTMMQLVKALNEDNGDIDLSDDESVSNLLESGSLDDLEESIAAIESSLTELESDISSELGSEEYSKGKSKPKLFI